MPDQFFLLLINGCPCVHIVKQSVYVGKRTIERAIVSNAHANVFAFFQFLSKYLFRIFEEIPTALIDFLSKAATAKHGAAPLDADLLAFFNWHDQFCFTAFQFHFFSGN